MEKVRRSAPANSLGSADSAPLDQFRRAQMLALEQAEEDLAAVEVENGYRNAVAPEDGPPSLSPTSVRVTTGNSDTSIIYRQEALP